MTCFTVLRHWVGSLALCKVTSRRLSAPTHIRISDIIKTINLELVQVHPTDLVKPDDFDVNSKFLGTGELFGVGSLVFDARCDLNKSERRDYVMGSHDVL